MVCWGWGLQKFLKYFAIIGMAFFIFEKERLAFSFLMFFLKSKREIQLLYSFFQNESVKEEQIKSDIYAIVIIRVVIYFVFIYFSLILPLQGLAMVF